MARKNKDWQTPEERKSAQDYYKLHSDAVNDLVSANEENSPVVSEAELRKYRSGSKIKLSETVKALLVKYWFNGAVCFFFFLGLGNYLRDLLDQLFVLGLAMGIFTDILVNNVLRFIAKPEGANDRWMMVPKKQLSSLFVNIAYAYVVLFFVYMFYNLVNTVLQSFGGSVLSVEPLLFGLFYLGFDLLFIAMKKLMIRIIDDAKKKV
ncbi:MAG: hypothetical protein IJI57_14815 [Flexilinea sp.]|nr:hypothetical protein [Flexilinea sp.]